MTANACPECYEPTDRRRHRQDARCDDCRTQVGRRRDRQGRGVRMAVVRDLGPGWQA